jgi:hypothetical protein
MTKKQIYIGVGIAAGAAVIYYFWRQRQIALQQAYLLQQQAQQGQAEEGESRFGGGGGGGGGGFGGGSFGGAMGLEQINPITPIIATTPIVSTTPIVAPAFIPKLSSNLGTAFTSSSSLGGLIPTTIPSTAGLGETSSAFTSPSISAASPTMSSSTSGIGATSTVSSAPKPPMVGKPKPLMGNITAASTAPKIK